jgi:predicted adenine nucleotide alpha hydrolase (AANH) superfamily ATPase
MKKLLLHVCCAPCSTYPLKVMGKDPFEVFGFFFNPNIHPFQEYAKRRDTVCDYFRTKEVPLILKDEYNLVNFLREVVYREKDRCRICYFMRLEAAAKTAQENKIDYFTTTLLYSRFQQHDLIREIGESLGRCYGVSFYYRDFREGWKEGIRLSKEAGLYRQQYCGCIYSEQERFDRIGPRQKSS